MSPIDIEGIFVRFGGAEHCLEGVRSGEEEGAGEAMVIFICAQLRIGYVWPL